MLSCLFRTSRSPVILWQLPVAQLTEAESCRSTVMPVISQMQQLSLWQPLHREGMQLILRGREEHARLLYLQSRMLRLDNENGS